MRSFKPKVAIVHDWLTGMRGGERCLEVICSMFPYADIFTLFYFPENISETIKTHNPRVSSLQRLPLARNYYRHYLPLYPLGISNLSKKLNTRALEINGYDLVISVSHCAAKNIKVPAATFHLCYCLTPMRYVWDQYDRYFGDRALEPLIRQIARYLRSWDVNGSSSVNKFVAISNFVKDRIKRVYGADSEVVYPPVRTDWIKPRNEGERGDGFLVVNALAPYKNTQIIIEAFNKLGLPLTVIGSGPERVRLEKLAKSNIKFIGFVSDEQLQAWFRCSKALVFAAEEDFGMTPVEMQAAGRPVIAFGKGGSLETVCIGGQQGRSGIFFPELTADSLCGAVQNFLDAEQEFTVNNCIRHATVFSLDRFHREFIQILNKVGIEAPNDLIDEAAVG